MDLDNMSIIVGYQCCGEAEHKITVIKVIRSSDQIGKAYLVGR